MVTKKCTACCVEKPREDFHKKSSNGDGITSQCKVCVLSFRRANYESKKQRYRDWYKSNAERLRTKYLAGAEKKREYQRVYGRDRYKNNPERVTEVKRAYILRNPGKSNARTAKRYADKTQATPAWASSAAIAAFYVEAARLTRETGVPYHVDHIIPLRSKLVCGLHHELNLQVMPGSENRQKSNSRWPDMP